MSEVALDAFLSHLEQSNLLTAEQLDAVRASADGVTPEQLAARLTGEGLLTRWQADMLLAGRHAFFLKKYKLLDHLGEGGMGSVLKAEQTPWGRLVAIKTLRMDLIANSEMASRFHREIEAAAALSHPHIVSAYDADSIAGQFFLVLEFVEGRDLSTFLKGGRKLPIGEACEYVRQAAIGLSHAHERGMIHRDIKPSNLLLTSDNDDRPLVKILDFGLARIEAGGGEELTHTGQIMGTPDYIAPEQARDSKSADARSDIYSLGCTLFRLLTGRPPFPQEGALEKITARLTDEPPSLRSALAEAPTELESVLLCMMARDPEERYQSAAEVIRALSPFASLPEAGAFAPTMLHLPTEPPTKARAEPVDPQLQDFLNHLTTEAAQAERAAVGDPSLAETVVGFDHDSNALLAPGTTGPPSSPKKSAPPPSLLAEIAERGRADRRRLRNAACLIAVCIAATVGYAAWDKAGETRLIVVWPLDQRDGATLKIDGRPRKLPPSERVKISGRPGRRKLEIQRDGYAPIEQSWNFARGQIVEFPLEWEPTAETFRKQRLKELGAEISRVNALFADPRPDPNHEKIASLKRRLHRLQVEESRGAESVAISKLLSRLPWRADLMRPTEIPRYEYEVAGGLRNKQPPGLVAVFGDSRLKHWDGVSGVEFSPDGKTLYSSDRQGVVKAWDVATFKELFSLVTDVSIRVLAISPDGKWLAAGRSSGTVQIWNLETRKAQEILRHTSQNFAVHSVDFSPSSRLLATAGGDGKTKLWSTEDWGLEQTLSGHVGFVEKVAFDVTGAKLASSGRDRTVRLWEVDFGKELHRIEDSSPSASQALGFSPDGSVLAYSTPNAIHFLDVVTGKNQTVKVPFSNAEDLEYSSDGTRLAIAAKESQVLIWDVARNRQVQVLPHYWVVSAVSFRPDGTVLASADWGKLVRLWDPSTGRLLVHERKRPDGILSALAVSPDGTWFGTAGIAGVVRLRHFDDGETFQEWDDFLGTNSRRSTIVTNADGTTIAYAGSGVGYPIQVRDIESGQRLWSLTGHGSFVTAMAGSSDGMALASSDGMLLASGSADRTCRIWNLKSGSVLHELKGFPSNIRSVDFSPDGKWLATAAEGVTVWDVPSGKPHRVLKPIVTGIGLRFHPDGGSLLAADSGLVIWNTSDWHATRRPMSEAGATDLSVSPDGYHIAVAHESGRISLFDGQSMQQRAVLQVAVPRGWINQTAFTPDGRHLVTANGNGTVYVLRLKEWSAE